MLNYLAISLLAKTPAERRITDRVKIMSLLSTIYVQFKLLPPCCRYKLRNVKQKLFEFCNVCLVLRLEIQK